MAKASSGFPNISSRVQLHFCSSFPGQLSMSAVTSPEILPLFLLLIGLFDTTDVIFHDKICIFNFFWEYYFIL